MCWLCIPTLIHPHGLKDKMILLMTTNIDLQSSSDTVHGITYGRLHWIQAINQKSQKEHRRAGWQQHCLFDWTAWKTTGQYTGNWSKGVSIENSNDGHSPPLLIDGIVILPSSCGFHFSRYHQYIEAEELLSSRVYFCLDSRGVSHSDKKIITPPSDGTTI